MIPIIPIPNIQGIDFSEWAPEDILELHQLCELQELDEMKEERKVLETSLSAFMKGAWHIIDPGHRFVPNWHLDYIAEHLEAVTLGQIKRLIVNVPRRTLKSTSVSIMWPTWSWAKKPASKWMFASYSGSLAMEHSQARRNILTHPWYRQRWPDTELRSWKIEQFTNTVNGKMIATSVTGTATGKGGDFLIADDLISVENGYSKAHRDQANRFFDQTFFTGRDDWATCAIVLIMQRLHTEDPTGHALAEEPEGWTHIKLPLEATRTETLTFPRSGRVHTRQPGESLFEARMPASAFPVVKRRMGPYAWAGQAQQEPSPLGGSIIMRHWFEYWQPKPATADSPLLPPVPVLYPDGTMHDKIARVLDLSTIKHFGQSWDCAFKALATSDFVAGLQWGQLDADVYILDTEYGQFSFGETKEAIKRLRTRWPKTGYIWVEDKANGTAVIDDLHDKVPGLKAVDPRGGKIARANVASPYISAGNLFLPHPTYASWVPSFIEECAVFPNAAHDDWVDALSQALVNIHQGTPSILRYFEMEAQKAEMAKREAELKKPKPGTIVYNSGQPLRPNGKH